LRVDNGSMANTVNPIPKDHHTVTPYLVLHDAAKFLDFAKQAFGASEIARHGRPDGTVMHAEMRIGDSVIMIGGAQDKPQTAMLHLYVPDCDASYERAIKAGAKSLREPADQFYGDRSGGVEDAWGNTWWFATHKEDLTSEEFEKRAAAQGKPK
jgi:PhnB protein